MSLMELSLCWVLVAVATCALCSAAWAADSYTVNNTACETIEEHGECRGVENNAGQTIMVPTKSAGEWSSFYGNAPTGVTINACTGGGSCAAAGGVDVGGYCWFSSSSSQSCDAACSGHGGCNLAGTRDYVGSGGSTFNCNAVLGALGLGSGSTGTDTGNAGGCMYVFGIRGRMTSPATTCSATMLFGVRACACNISTTLDGCG